MKSHPKITIIIPSFNQGEFLETTIKSIVSQKYPNLECLIFDGGSTDNSVKIIKDYSKKHPYIKWQSQKDKGQVDAINKGLKLADGDIIAYINSDDFYLQNSFKKVVNFFQKNPKKLWLVGDCNVTQNSLKWTFFLKKITPFHLFRTALFLYNPINQPAVFLRSELIKKVGFFHYQFHFAFDYDYWLRCSKFGLPGRLNHPLATFRVHTNAKGSTSYINQFQESYSVMSKHTSNPVLKALHRFGQAVIVLTYTFLKR